MHPAAVSEPYSKRVWIVAMFSLPSRGQAQKELGLWLCIRSRLGATLGGQTQSFVQHVAETTGLVYCTHIVLTAPQMYVNA